MSPDTSLMPLARWAPEQGWGQQVVAHSLTMQQPNIWASICHRSLAGLLESGDEKESTEGSTLLQGLWCWGQVLRQYLYNIWSITAVGTRCDLLASEQPLADGHLWDGCQRRKKVKLRFLPDAAPASSSESASPLFCLWCN
jgi:hypothetical protein